jgi:cytochrome oxidase Cu insertion factor (SCO1/SenC/PrrC family)
MQLADLLRRRAFAVGAAAVLAFAVAGGAAWFVLAPAISSMAGGEATVGGPFTLTDQHGAEVTERDFAGRYMLVYFGYTYCPDICPLSLANMTQAVDLLPPDQADQVVPILITVDPERDTVNQLAEYAPLFHPRLVALTGSPEAIKAAAQAYRVYFAKAGKDGTDDYLMDHSTFIYLMGPEGRYVRHFAHNAAPEEIAAGIEAALAQG